MPIYEYVCMSCESHFEELVRHDEVPPARNAGRRRRSSSSRCSRPTAQPAAEFRVAASAGRRAVLLWRELWLRRPLSERLPTSGAVARRVSRRRSSGLHALRARRDAHPGRLRVGLADRRPDVRRGGARVPRGQAGHPVRRRRRAAAWQAARAIGLCRDDVFICNVLKRRPPGNRDPLPEEIEACESHLFRQIELIRRAVVVTLGNFATKLLSGQARRDHPRPRRRAGGRPRRPRVLPLPDLPPRGGALHARGCSRCSSRISSACPRCSAARRPATSSRSRLRAAAGTPEAAVPARPLLSAPPHAWPSVRRTYCGQMAARQRHHRGDRAPPVRGSRLGCVAGDVVGVSRGARSRQDDLRPRRLPRSRA